MKENAIIYIINIAAKILLLPSTSNQKYLRSNVTYNKSAMEL